MAYEPSWLSFPCPPALRANVVGQHHARDLKVLCCPGNRLDAHLGAYVYTARIPWPRRVGSLGAQVARSHFGGAPTEILFGPHAVAAHVDHGGVGPTFAMDRHGRAGVHQLRGDAAPRRGLGLDAGGRPSAQRLVGVGPHRVRPRQLPQDATPHGAARACAGS